MRTARTWGLLSCALIVTGCAGPTALLSPALPYDYDSVACRKPPTTAGDTYASALCADIAVLGDLEKQYYEKTGSPAAQKDLRDQWVIIIMRDVDQLFWQFEGKLTGRSEIEQTITETAITGMAAASAGVTAVAGKTALAVISATLSGFNTSFSKNVLQEQTMAALFAAATANRIAIEAQIKAGLTNGVDKYSLALAERDVMDYGQAGSLNAALASLSEKVGLAADKAKKQRADVSPAAVQ
ncbi:hypothetical protein [Paraburkholderia unamae]|uniref:Uncharacterized protein n=1 Tax=Paraburkholderia unamae TaxID=219649 RepID=A0ACC6RXG1_9BURK